MLNIVTTRRNDRLHLVPIFYFTRYTLKLHGPEKGLGEDIAYGKELIDSGISGESEND